MVRRGRRQVLALAMAPALLVVAAPAQAAAARPGEVVDYVLHAGVHAGGVAETASVAGGPYGGFASGHVAYRESFGEAARSARILCLQVRQNRAFVLWRAQPGQRPPGDLVLTEFVDNAGTPGSPDLIRNSFLEGGGFLPPAETGPGFRCGRPVNEPVPLESGDIVVHDGRRTS